MKQTAVLWVMGELSTLNGLKELGGIDNYEYFHRLKEIEQKGLTMEKEQIMNAYKHGRCDEQFKDTLASFYKTTPEQYYNETFKSE
jgi:hypothetical protein